MSMTEASAEKHSEHHHETVVAVSVDGRKVELAAGQYCVTDLKIRFGVPAEYELEIVEHGQFRPLEDTSHIHIKGGEEFVSHVRCGASS